MGWRKRGAGGGAGAVVASYFDQSTNLTSTDSLTDIVLLRQDGGAELGFDLTDWQDGSLLALWCSVTTWNNDAGIVVFTPRIEEVDGTLVQALPAFCESPAFNFPGATGCCVRAGPFDADPALRVRVHWRLAPGSAQFVIIDPDGSGSNDLPGSFQAFAMQLRT